MYLEDIDAWLATMNADMFRRLSEKIMVFLFGFGMVAVFVLLAAQRLMAGFSRELDHLVTDEEESLPVDVDRFRFSELRGIAEKSNAILAQKAKTQIQLMQAQKMESLGVLAGGVAHDFNNHLQAMSGNIQMLLMNRTEDHPETRRLKTVAYSIDRAARLVRQMLLFSRKAEIVCRPVDLNLEIQEAAKLLERIIPRMIAVETRLEDGLWHIRADPVQVEQVILNLATNAVDAMPDGGLLLVETRNVTLDAEFVRTQPGLRPEPYVLLTVTDTGSGMDNQILSQIFDPFFTTKGVGKGTGLGLATVYGIVKNHGGAVLCYSEPGQGTTFRIYWLVEPVGSCGATAVQAVEAPDVATPRSGEETILVVDDEENIRELTAEVLESAGYNVFTASSGEEALAVFADKCREIALVVLDLGMPGMGGRQCLRELRKRDPEVRVLIASGYAGGNLTGEVREQGSSGFIAKPFQLRELLAAVREILDGKGR